MRKILSMMAEIRAVQLAAAGAPSKRLAEARDMFVQLDGLLSGMKPTDPGNKLEETMVTADFTHALTEFVQRLMVPGYTAKRFNFEAFIKPDTVPNFLPVKRYQRRAELEDLEWVGEKGQARPGSVVDATPREYQVEIREKQFDFSMQALVNDDLGYFNEMADMMGRAARRSQEKYVSRMMWNAVTLARLVALGALYSTTGRLTTARISTARMAFNQRVDDRGEPIAAALAYIVYHAGLVDQVKTIQNSTLVPELATNAANVVATAFVGIEDPYVAAAAPNLPWFGLADWRLNGIVPFVLARRDGVPAPLILRKRSDIESMTSLLGAGGGVPPVMGDFSSGNVEVKVHDEWGTYIDGTEGNMFDNRGCYYSSGTAA